MHTMASMSSVFFSTPQGGLLDRVRWVSAATQKPIVQSCLQHVPLAQIHTYKSCGIIGVSLIK